MGKLKAKEVQRVQDDCITVALRLPEVRVIRQVESDEGITVEVGYRARGAPCPRCGQFTPKVHSVRAQRKRDRSLPTGSPLASGTSLCSLRLRSGQALVLHKRRLRCLRCRKVFSEPDPVFGVRRRSRRRFREYLGREALHQTVRHLARREGVGEGLVRRSVTELARHLLEAPGGQGHGAG